MTDLVRRAKELEREREKIAKELPVWSRRVELAREKGMDELAEQARQRHDDLQARRDEIRTKLDVIGQEKDMLRYQSKRPSGREVERAEAMVEQVRQGGLIDPDEAKMERELDELVTFDFGDMGGDDEDQGGDETKDPSDEQEGDRE